MIRRPEPDETKLRIIEDVIRRAAERGDESVDIDRFSVPILSAGEVGILALYGDLGRDANGRPLVAEMVAMMALLDRLGVDYRPDELMATWSGIRAEEDAYRAERAKK